MEFECETPLLAKCQKRVNTFFYFFPIFILPEVSSPAATLPRPAKAQLLAERAKVCQYFFKDFFEFLSARMTSVAARQPKFCCGLPSAVPPGSAHGIHENHEREKFLISRDFRVFSHV
jgi:hypothetical protein